MFCNEFLAIDVPQIIAGWQISPSFKLNQDSASPIEGSTQNDIGLAVQLPSLLCQFSEFQKLPINTYGHATSFFSST
jgi:hypothetical protein